MKDIKPMLIYIWPAVFDDDSTLIQQLANFLCSVTKQL